MKDQKELLFQIFAYLRTFQNWIVSEVSWFQSIIYYTVSCILSALFSASKKTSNARIVLFTSLSLNVIIERMIVQYYDNISNQMSETKVDLVTSIWVVRKTALAICFVTLLYTYWSYKDEHFENFKVLKRIENRLDSLENISPILGTNAISKFLFYLHLLFFLLFINPFSFDFLILFRIFKTISIKTSKKLC